MDGGDERKVMVTSRKKVTGDGVGGELVDDRTSVKGSMPGTAAPGTSVEASERAGGRAQLQYT